MPKFNDENTLDCILGCIWLAESWEPRSDFCIQDLLGEIADRIRAKIERCKNSVRRSWFSEALEHVSAASAAYGSRQSSDGDEHLRKAGELLQQGNKAHRRGTRFIAGPDGTIEKA